MNTEPYLTTFTQHVVVDNVCFSYTNKAVLKGISFGIKAGESVAIVGASGEGKSTLAKILLGLYTPDMGSVTVGGACSTTESTPNIAAIFQDPMLVTGTVLDNILIGEALDTAHLETIIKLVVPDLIAALPNGLETEVGDRGRQLSVGQQQRVALMRALYRKPDFLVADEPTSALDGQAEQRASAALQAAKERAAIIIFSHRLNTVRSADTVISIKNGTIKEAGTPDTLAKNSGEFSSLFPSEIKLP